MKKTPIRLLITMMLSLCILGGIFSVCASAQSVTAVSSSEIFTRQDENFTTTVYIPDNANIVDFDITLTYDTSLITLVSAAENDDIKGTVVFNTDIPGEIAINYTRTSKNVTSYLPIVDFTFKVDPNIGIGSYDCFKIDHTNTYIAHTLNSAGTLDEVDFQCEFSPLVIYEMGDVDLSGKVDIGDATYIRRHLAKIEGAILTDYKLSFADTYFDEVVDIADAVCLQRRLARMDVLYGNRVNITFVDINGNKYTSKSVLYDGDLLNVPRVPDAEGYSGGKWSASADGYTEPVFTKMTADMTVYAYYETEDASEAVEYYKRMLTDQYYSGDMATNLSSDLSLWSSLNYQSGYHASFIWSSDCNYVLNSTTGKFTKPTYPKDMSLTAKIISYDADDIIEAEDEITFKYAVPGEFKTPEKAAVEDWLKHYFTDTSDNKYRVNYDVKLVSRLNNTVLPTEGASYDNFEIRLDWYQVVEGVEMPISHIKRTTTKQVNDYVAVASFNGKPIEGHGKIYFDNVEVTEIEQVEIKNYIINQIAANMGTLATDGTVLWNNDQRYGTKITWETGAVDIAYVTNNMIELKDDAISGSTLPLNARVSYEIDGGAEEFVLSYNLTVSCNNTTIKAPENMDKALYAAIKEELEETLGYSGDLTSAALGNVKFVNLDLSKYKDGIIVNGELLFITSLRGLSYCTNLRTLNMSGIKITDGTMNQIATLSYLEAFVARDCGLDNLADGGTATLRNATSLKMIDLTGNSFTSLDSVFAEGSQYGGLREVYLSNNKLTDINALKRAPLVTYLSLSGNGLTTEGTAAIADYPYLQYLSLAYNKIDSVQHLTGLKYLTELRLHNNELTDVRALRGLVNLKLLYLGHNKIKDVGFLSTLTALEVLYVNDNSISDISLLSTLTKLEIVNVSNNSISSLSVLRNYKDTLLEIYAENNKLTDFSFINGASKLSILMLSGNKAEIAQTNMSTWLSALGNLEVLTLSDIKLADLSFLESMDRLVRLDVANCSLAAFTGDSSNIQSIADKYATLKILDISNNDFSANEEEIKKLGNLSLLTVLYADNISRALDARTLTYSMPDLMYVSLENCGISSTVWLSKYSNLAYVDLAGNNIAEVDLNTCISNASIKTLKELYLDTNVDCAFSDANRIIDFNVEKLSFEGVNVGKVEYLPYLDKIEYLNLANTGITNLTGDDPEMQELYSLERYTTLKTVDVSGLETDISLLEDMDSVECIYAVGALDSKLFHESNLHALQRLYNKGVICYLYDKSAEYVPNAKKEGVDILGLIKDLSCDITVAANKAISDNNPLIPSEINDFDIKWTVSNSVNYEIVDNRLSVKSYEGLEDEALTLTAEITVYPDQAPVTRTFTINTHILRIAPKYYDIDATGYSEQLSRDAVFSYELILKAAETEDFSMPVMPVLDRIDYTYTAVLASGTSTSYKMVISIGSDNRYTIASAAPLGATVTIDICAGHVAKDGGYVEDMEHIRIPVTVASRTYTATFVMNGGSIKDTNGADRSTCSFVEDSLIFENLTYSRPGYRFAGWYSDAEFKSAWEGEAMPSMDITLYAKWDPLSYTVNFDANGGTVSPSSMTALSDVALGTLPTPTRTYYTFNGWFTAQTGGTKVSSTTTFARTENITLYAQWTLNSYVITFNANGGSVSTSTLRGYCGQAIGSLPTPTRDYYIFNGWYTQASGGSKVTSSYVASVANNLTLYAQWTLKDTVGWVNASSVPAGAQITESKWSYTLREYTSSESSSMSGWTKYDTQRTSWGAWSSWSTTNPTDGIRYVESRSVYDHTEYHYYRWTNGYSTYTYKKDSGYWLEEKWFTYILPVSQYGSSIGYVGKDTTPNIWARADYAGNYTTDKTFTRTVNRTEWRYREPVYTYYFYRDVSMEATYDPTGQSNVSNVVRWVKYRPK